MSLAQELITPLLNDARALAKQGFATPADIDTAMRLGAGHPKGPLEILGEVAPPPVTASPGEAEQPCRPPWSEPGRWRPGSPKCSLAPAPTP